MSSGSSNRTTGDAESRTRRSVLSQDPHAVREPREHNLERTIGRAVRERRTMPGVTLADLAAHEPGAGPCAASSDRS